MAINRGSVNKMSGGGYTKHSMGKTPYSPAKGNPISISNSKRNHNEVDRAGDPKSAAPASSGNWPGGRQKSC